MLSAAKLTKLMRDVTTDETAGQWPRDTCVAQTSVLFASLDPRVLTDVTFGAQAVLCGLGLLNAQ